MLFSTDTSNDPYNDQSTLHLILEGKDMANVGGFFGSTDPFFCLLASAPTSAGAVLWQNVYTSEECPSNLHPRWKKAEINLKLLCQLDLNKPIRIKVDDWEPSDKHNPMGFFDTTVADLLKVSGDASKTAPLRQKGEEFGKLIVRLARIKTPRNLDDNSRRSSHSRRSTSASKRSRSSSAAATESIHRKGSRRNLLDDNPKKSIHMDHPDMMDLLDMSIGSNECDHNDVFHLTLEGRDLVHVAGWFDTTNPYFQIAIAGSNPSDAGKTLWQTVYRSEHLQDNLAPFWKEAPVTLYLLCGGDLQKSFRIFVYSRVDAGGDPLSMGYFDATVRELIKASNDESKTFLLKDAKTAEEYGKIVVRHAQLPEDYTEGSFSSLGSDIAGEEQQLDGKTEPLEQPPPDEKIEQPAPEKAEPDDVATSVFSLFGFGPEQPVVEKTEPSVQPAQEKAEASEANADQGYFGFFGGSSDAADQTSEGKEEAEGPKSEGESLETAPQITSPDQPSTEIESSPASALPPDMPLEQNETETTKPPIIDTGRQSNSEAKVPAESERRRSSRDSHRDDRDERKSSTPYSRSSTGGKSRQHDRSPPRDSFASYKKSVKGLRKTMSQSHEPEPSSTSRSSHSHSRKSAYRRSSSERSLSSSKNSSSRRESFSRSRSHSRMEEQSRYRRSSSERSLSSRKSSPKRDSSRRDSSLHSRPHASESSSRKRSSSPHSRKEPAILDQSASEREGSTTDGKPPLPDVSSQTHAGPHQTSPETESTMEKQSESMRFPISSLGGDSHSSVEAGSQSEREPEYSVLEAPKSTQSEQPLNEEKQSGSRDMPSQSQSSELGGGAQSMLVAGSEPVKDLGHTTLDSSSTSMGKFGEGEQSLAAQKAPPSSPRKELLSHSQPHKGSELEGSKSGQLEQPSNERDLPSQSQSFGLERSAQSALVGGSQPVKDLGHSTLDSSNTSMGEFGEAERSLAEEKSPPSPGTESLSHSSPRKGSPQFLYLMNRSQSSQTSTSGLGASKILCLETGSQSVKGPGHATLDSSSTSMGEFGEAERSLAEEKSPQSPRRESLSHSSPRRGSPRSLYLMNRSQSSQTSTSGLGASKILLMEVGSQSIKAGHSTLDSSSTSMGEFVQAEKSLAEERTPPLSPSKASLSNSRPRRGSPRSSYLMNRSQALHSSTAELGGSKNFATGTGSQPERVLGRPTMDSSSTSMGGFGQAEQPLAEEKTHPSSPRKDSLSQFYPLRGSPRSSNLMNRSQALHMSTARLGGNNNFLMGTGSQSVKGLGYSPLDGPKRGRPEQSVEDEKQSQPHPRKLSPRSSYLKRRSESLLIPSMGVGSNTSFLGTGTQLENSGHGALDCSRRGDSKIVKSLSRKNEDYKSSLSGIAQVKQALRTESAIVRIGHEETTSKPTGQTNSVDIQARDATFHLRLAGKDLVNMGGWFGSTNALYEISCSVDNTRNPPVWQRVYLSEHVENSLNPAWKEVDLNLGLVCDGDLTKQIRIRLFDWKQDGKHTSMGSCITTPNDLLQSVVENSNLIVSSEDGKENGRLMVADARIERRKREDDTGKEFPSIGNDKAVDSMDHAVSQKAMITPEIPTMGSGKAIDSMDHAVSKKAMITPQIPTVGSGKAIDPVDSEASRKEVVPEISTIGRGKPVYSFDHAVFQKAVSPEISTIKSSKDFDDDGELKHAKQQVQELSLARDALRMSLAKSQAEKDKLQKITSKADPRNNADDESLASIVDSKRFENQQSLLEKNAQEKKMLLDYSRTLAEKVSTLEETVSEMEILLETASKKVERLLADKRSLQLECVFNVKKMNDISEAKIRQEEKFIDIKAESLSYKRDLDRAFKKMADLVRYRQQHGRGMTPIVGGNLYDPAVFIPLPDEKLLDESNEAKEQFAETEGAREETEAVESSSITPHVEEPNFEKYDGQDNIDANTEGGEGKSGSTAEVLVQDESVAPTAGTTELGDLVSTDDNARNEKSSGGSSVQAEGKSGVTADETETTPSADAEGRTVSNKDDTSIAGSTKDEEETRLPNVNDPTAQEGNRDEVPEGGEMAVRQEEEWRTQIEDESLARFDFPEGSENFNWEADASGPTERDASDARGNVETAGEDAGPAMQRDSEAVAALTSEKGVLTQMVATLEHRVEELEQETHDRIVADSQEVASTISRNSMLDRRTLEVSLARAEFKVQSYAAAMLAEGRKMKDMMRENKALAEKMANYKRLAEKNFKTVKEAKTLLARYKADRQKQVSQRITLNEGLNQVQAVAKARQQELKIAQKKLLKLEKAAGEKSKLIDEAKLKFEQLEAEKSGLESIISELRKGNDLFGLVTKGVGSGPVKSAVGTASDETGAASGFETDVSGDKKGGDAKSWKAEKQALQTRIMELEARFERAIVDREAAVAAEDLYQGFWKDAKEELARLHSKDAPLQRSNSLPSPASEGLELATEKPSDDTADNILMNWFMSDVLEAKPSTTTDAGCALWAEDGKMKEVKLIGSKQSRKTRIRRANSTDSGLQLWADEARETDDKVFFDDIIKPGDEAIDAETTAKRASSNEGGKLMPKRANSTGTLPNKSSSSKEAGQRRPPKRASSTGKLPTDKSAKQRRLSARERIKSTVAIRASLKEAADESIEQERISAKERIQSNVKKRVSSKGPNKPGLKRSTGSSIDGSIQLSPVAEVPDLENSKSTHMSKTLPSDIVSLLNDDDDDNATTNDDAATKAESKDDDEDNETTNDDAVTKGGKGKRPSDKKKRASNRQGRRPSSRPSKRPSSTAERQKRPSWGKRDSGKTERSRLAKKSPLSKLAPVPVEVTKRSSSSVRRSSYRVARRHSQASEILIRQSLWKVQVPEIPDQNEAEKHKKKGKGKSKEQLLAPNDSDDSDGHDSGMMDMSVKSATRATSQGSKGKKGWFGGSKSPKKEKKTVVEMENSEEGKEDKDGSESENAQSKQKDDLDDSESENSQSKRKGWFGKKKQSSSKSLMDSDDDENESEDESEKKDEMDGSKAVNSKRKGWFGKKKQSSSDSDDEGDDEGGDKSEKKDEMDGSKVANSKRKGWFGKKKQSSSKSIMDSDDEDNEGEKGEGEKTAFFYGKPTKASLTDDDPGDETASGAGVDDEKLEREAPEHLRHPSRVRRTISTNAHARSTPRRSNSNDASKAGTRTSWRDRSIANGSLDAASGHSTIEELREASRARRQLKIEAIEANKEAGEATDDDNKEGKRASKTRKASVPKRGSKPMKAANNNNEGKREPKKKRASILKRSSKTKKGKK